MKLYRSTNQDGQLNKSQENTICRIMLSAADSRKPALKCAPDGIIESTHAMNRIDVTSYQKKYANL